MGCCLELALLAFGGYLIFAGEFKTVGGKVVSGGIVRVAGIIYCLPLPLSFVIGFFIGFSQAMKGRTTMPKDWIGVLGLMEIGIIGGCVVLGSLLLAFAALNPPQRSKRREGYGFDADFPYVAEQRRRIDFDEVFDTHSPALPPMPPPLPEHAQAVVAERPALPAPAPRHWEGDDEFLKSEFPRARSERQKAGSEGKQTLLVLAMAVVIFLVVAGVGAVLMWPK
jgi:hypothetical protein